MFAYCFDNPVMLVDNDGTRPCAGMTMQDEASEERCISCAFQVQVSMQKFSSSTSSGGKKSINVSDSFIAYGLIAIKKGWQYRIDKAESSSLM